MCQRPLFICLQSLSFIDSCIMRSLYLLHKHKGTPKERMFSLHIGSDIWASKYWLMRRHARAGDVYIDKFSNLFSGGGK